MTYISRDPFARQELQRHTVRTFNFPKCSWCGNTNRQGHLYQYIVESDGGRRFPIAGEFCSVGCMRSYHS